MKTLTSSGSGTSTVTTATTLSVTTAQGMMHCITICLQRCSYYHRSCSSSAAVSTGQIAFHGFVYASLIKTQAMCKVLDTLD